MNPTASDPGIKLSILTQDTEDETTGSELVVTRDPQTFATLNRQFNWELAWQPAKAVAPGTEFQLRCRNLRVFVEWTYHGIQLVPGTEANFESFAKPSSAGALASFMARGLAIGQGSFPKGLHPGQVLEMRVRAVPSYFAGLDEMLSIWLAAPLSSGTHDEVNHQWVKQENASAVLHVGPGPVERLAVYSHPMPGADGLVRTVLSPEDRFGNQSAFANEITLSLEWAGETWSKSTRQAEILKLPAPSGVGRLRVEVEAGQLSPGDNITNGRIENGRIMVQGNPVWSESPSGNIAGFGEFHWHSELSGDGSGRLDTGMELARDQLNMNYCVATDHWPKGRKWLDYVAVMEQFNITGYFATLFGYESSVNDGHDNYYFLDPNNPLNPDGAEEICHLPPAEYRVRLDQSQRDLDEDQKIIAIPHHTNTESESYRVDGTPYWPAYSFGRGSQTHRLIEVFQTRGNMERNAYTDAWRGWYAKGASVQDALAAGYKLGFTGGTDNHCGHPGFCFAWADVNRGRIPLQSQSLTGVWADQVERRSLWKALYNRQTWAVWDTRALVHFEVNGTMAGGGLQIESGEPLNARAKISAEDSLQSLEIISDGKTCWSSSIEPLDIDLKIDLGRAGRSTYFYLRGLQRNGGIFYASPVFVTVAQHE